MAALQALPVCALKPSPMGWAKLWRAFGAGADVQWGMSGMNRLHRARIGCAPPRLCSKPKCSEAIEFSGINLSAANSAAGGCETGFFGCPSSVPSKPLCYVISHQSSADGARLKVGEVSAGARTSVRRNVERSGVSGVVQGARSSDVPAD
jgi:hypothetical protein